MVYLQGSDERQQAIADVLSRQAAAQLGQATRKSSGTQHYCAGRHHDGAPGSPGDGA